jgi:hypothetical protein
LKSILSYGLGIPHFKSKKGIVIFSFNASFLIDIKPIQELKLKKGSYMLTADVVQIIESGYTSIFLKIRGHHYNYDGISSSVVRDNSFYKIIGHEELGIFKVSSTVKYGHGESYRDVELHPERTKIKTKLKKLKKEILTIELVS